MTAVPETTVGDVPEMIARVAKAICKSGEFCCENGPQSSCFASGCEDAARAAIAAMREPTSAVVEAVRHEAPWHIEREEWVGIWAAGIDAALGNPPVAG